MKLKYIYLIFLAPSIFINYFTLTFIDNDHNLSVFSKQCDKRISFYKKNNYEIHVYKMDGSKEKLEKRKSKKKKEIHEIKECLIED